MNDNKCPICNKAGIADYRINGIVCPACNTDLSVFTLLNKGGKTRNTLRNALFGLTALLMLIIIFVSISAKQIKEGLTNKLSESETLNSQMQDSVAALHRKIVQLQPGVKNLSGGSVHYYTIRKGDSFCLISVRLYGTEKRSKEIADLNKKDLNAIIYPGDTILVHQN